MLNIIDKTVVVKTFLGEYKGKALFYNGGNKITIIVDNTKTIQVVANDMVIEVLEEA